MTFEYMSFLQKVLEQQTRYEVSSSLIIAPKVFHLFTLICGFPDWRWDLAWVVVSKNSEVEILKLREQIST